MPSNEYTRSKINLKIDWNPNIWLCCYSTSYYLPQIIPDGSFLIKSANVI